SRGRVEAIHCNNRSMAPLRIPAAEVAAFYRAYVLFSRLLHDSRYMFSTHLEEGDAVVFDNRRILHGRTAFSSADPRRLQGCYLEKDGLQSQIAILRSGGCNGLFKAPSSD